MNFHGNGRAGDGQHKATEGTLHNHLWDVENWRYCDGVFIRLVCTNFDKFLKRQINVLFLFCVGILKRRI